jgi:hypothetical protein
MKEKNYVTTKRSQSLLDNVIHGNRGREVILLGKKTGGVQSGSQTGINISTRTALLRAPAYPAELCGYGYSANIAVLQISRVNVMGTPSLDPGAENKITPVPKLQGV